MKEEKFGEGIPERDDTPQSNTGPHQPFDPANETRDDKLKHQSQEHNIFRHLSRPPQRDNSGRRIDVDDAAFGIEIW